MARLRCRRLSQACGRPGLLIFELALGTGQRASDLTRMEWEHIEDGGIWVTQGKDKSPPLDSFHHPLSPPS